MKYQSNENNYIHGSKFKHSRRVQVCDKFRAKRNLPRVHHIYRTNVLETKDSHTLRMSFFSNLDNLKPTTSPFSFLTRRVTSEFTESHHSESLAQYPTRPRTQYHHNSLQLRLRRSVTRWTSCLCLESS